MLTQTEVISSQRQLNTVDRFDVEKVFLDNLLITAYTSGIKVDPITIINLYVSLKSKSAVLLVGQENCGKKDLINIFAQLLTGGDITQYQTMLGHAWWAEHSEKLALFTNAQAQLIEEKNISLLQNALKPLNKDQAFVVFIEKISPAETVWYFSEFFFQLRRMILTPKSGKYPQAPDTYPPNFFSIGTMDVPNFKWYDEDLLAQANVIHWHYYNEKNRTRNPSEPSLYDLNGKKELIHSRILDAQGAYKKLLSIIRDLPNALLPIIEVEKMLLENGVEFSQGSMRNEVVIYLANAWTYVGIGLFDSSLTRNLEIALDLAIAQSVLPRGLKAISHSNKLRMGLRSILNDRFDYSRKFLID